MRSGCHRRDARRGGFRRRVARGRGFTLIEAAFTTIIIGVGVVAMVEAQQGFMRSNAWSTEASTAAFLAGEIREMTRLLPRHDPTGGLFIDGSGASAVLRGWGREAGEVEPSDLDDIDDFDGLIFSWNGAITDFDRRGPINAAGELIGEIDAAGNVLVVTTSGVTSVVPMQGWSQRVDVEKVLPSNTNPATPLSDSFVDAFRDVDEFPLRVTVTVFRQIPGVDANPREITRMVWVVP